MTTTDDKNLKNEFAVFYTMLHIHWHRERWRSITKL